MKEGMKGSNEMVRQFLRPVVAMFIKNIGIGEL